MLKINVFCLSMLGGIICQWYCTLVDTSYHHHLFFMYPNSFMSFVIHMAYLVICVFAMYLASIVDKVIMGCYLLLQKKTPPAITNTNPMVDTLSSRWSTQFSSQYPTISWGGNPLKCNLNCECLANIEECAWLQSNVLGLDMCWLTTLIGYAKSNRVHNMAHIKDHTSCW
jgi:hypothetical protein